MADTDTKNQADAADMLRAWALDEELKKSVMGNPILEPVVKRIARRYTAGERIEDALAAACASMARGHAASLEYTGESVRDPAVAEVETAVFLQLAEVIASSGLPSTVSFDLSHVGSVIDPELGLANAQRIATATAGLGTALMISAEGSDRTDLVLDTYESLSLEHPHVGITLQARLHRTPADLERVLRLPGIVRLVKGAFLEPESIAHPRGSSGLEKAYLHLAQQLLDAGHPTAIATHDDALIEKIRVGNDIALRGTSCEFEMLIGLGTESLDRLHHEGFNTREYVVFGGEWWLYVLNRIAEEPHRVNDAIIDAGRQNHF